MSGDDDAAAATDPWPDDLFAGLRSDDGPLHGRISRRLERAIRDGTVPPGARIENEIALATRLGVSRPTVRRAIQDLVDHGLVVRRRGIGTQVVQGHITRPVELTSLFDDLVRAHHVATTRLLERGRERARSDVAESLAIPRGTPVIRLRRLRLADESPVAVLVNHLPAEFDDIADAELEEGGLYGALSSRGVEIRVARQRIGARRAEPTEAALLDIEEGAPVLTVERVGFDASGRAVELGRHCYRPDLYDFETTLVSRSPASSAGVFP